MLKENLIIVVEAHPPEFDPISWKPWKELDVMACTNSPKPHSPVQTRVKTGESKRRPGQPAWSISTATESRHGLNRAQGDKSQPDVLLTSTRCGTHVPTLSLTRQHKQNETSRKVGGVDLLEELSAGQQVRLHEDKPASLQLSSSFF